MAPLASAAVATRSYTVAVPKNQTFHQFVDTPLQVTSSALLPVAVRQPTAPFSVGAQPVTIQLNVQ